MHRYRPRLAALVALGALALTGLTAPTVAGAAEPGGDTYHLPSPTIEAVITDDALYTLSATTSGVSEVKNPALYARSLTQTAEAVELGVATLVARASGYSLAEHDGSLAYLRAKDGRLVLRSADGRETVPGWADRPEIVRSGPTAMDDAWVLVGGRTLYRKSDGRVLDLAAASPSPAGFTVSAGSVAIGEGQVMWAASGWPRGSFGRWEGVFHAPLTSDGLGTVTTVVDEITRDIGAPLPPVSAVGIVNGYAVWSEDRHFEEMPVLTLESAALSTGERTESVSLGMYRSWAKTYTDADGVTVEVLEIGTDLGRSSKVLRTAWPAEDEQPTPVELAIAGSVLDAEGSLVALGTDGGMALHDMDGRAVRRQPPSGASTFVTQVPERIVADPTVTPGDVSCVSVRGRHGVPEDATGVVVNVTANRPQSLGYAVVFPDTGAGATPMPTSSTVNFERDKDVANSAFVALPENGRICYATAGTARAGVLIDLAGYTREGSGVVTGDPVRVLDTRPGPGQVGPVTGAVRNGTVHTLDVVEAAGLPSTATAVLLNVTVTQTPALGHLRVFPGGQEPPDISTVNYAPGKDKASATVAALSNAGEISFASFSGGSAHVAMDVVGYVEAGSSFHGVTPERIMDTRPGAFREGLVAGPVRAGDVHSVPVRGAGGVPADATGVVLTVTAVAPASLGHLRVAPDTGGDGRTPPPDTSVLNYVVERPARAIPNMVVAALPENGQINFQSVQGAGGVHLIADVVGYITD